MARLNLVPDEYIGSNELNRLQDFLKEGYTKVLSLFIKRYGIQPNVVSQQIGPLYVGNRGADTVFVKAGFAFDQNLNIIEVPSDQDITVLQSGQTPNSSSYLLVKHKFTSVEVGTVNVSNSGDLTGTGTKFTDVLRGYPGEPVSVRFPNSSLNTGEYPVSEVNSDTTAILNSVGLYNESNLQYEVLGAFPANVHVSPINKKLYLYDSFEFEILTFIPADTELRIPIARFDYDSDGNLNEIIDLRPDYTIQLN